MTRLRRNAVSMNRLPHLGHSFTAVVRLYAWFSPKGEADITMKIDLFSASKPSFRA